MAEVKEYTKFTYKTIIPEVTNILNIMKVRLCLRGVCFLVMCFFL